ncbi:MAG: DUF47 family protein [Candidatus Undinarchaeales archaeon]
MFPLLKKGRTDEFYRELEEFVEEVHSSVVSLSKAVEKYADGKQKEAEKFGEKVFKSEEIADRKRRFMENTLYSGAIIPFGRDSKYELVEAIDDVADKAEIIARLLKYENVKIPKDLKKDIKELAKKTVETSEKLATSVKSLNVDLRAATSAAYDVNTLREEARRTEFKTFEKLFSGKKKSINLILLKEIISLIGQVSDKAEEAADRVITLSVKYKG